MKLEEEGKDVYLTFTFDKAYYNHQVELITTEILGEAKIPRMRFENADGTPLQIDTDYFGHLRTNDILVGPFTNLEEGEIKLKVW